MHNTLTKETYKMARSIPVTDVEGILECKLCLGKFRDPKSLVCHHIFCKECLEDVIKFTADGAAVIPCPLRCANETHVDKNKTLNDLGTAFEIKAILETLNLSANDNLVHECTYMKDCDKEISVYCCGLMMCNYCYQKHGTQVPHQGKTNITIDANDGQLAVICDEHLSRCKHVCTDATHDNGTKFVCVYCVNRAHKEHPRETLEEQARRLKEALNNTLRNIEKLHQIHKVTEENIFHCRNKLNELLRERKKECLIQYIDLLNRDEERIRNEYVNIVAKHLEQYPSAVDSAYCKENLLKDGIDMVLEKDAILNTICKQNYLQLSFSCVDVSLSDSIDFQSKFPLGCLNVGSGAHSAFTDLQPCMPTFKDCMTGNSFNYQEISAKFSQQLEILQNHDSSCEPKMKSKGYQAEVKQLDMELHEISETVNNNKDNNVQLEGKCASYDQEVKRLTELVEEYSNMIYTLESKCQSLADEIACLKLDKVGTDNSLKMHQELNELQASNQKLLEDYQGLDTSRSVYEKEVHAERERYKIRIKELKDEKSKLAHVNDSSNRPRCNISRIESEIEKLCLIKNETELSDAPMGRVNTSPESYGYKPVQSTDCNNSDTSPILSVYKPLLIYEPLRSTECNNPEVIMKSSQSSNISTDSIPQRSKASNHQVDNVESSGVMLSTVPFCPVSIKDLAIGMRISMTRANGRLSRGTIKWIGTLPRHSGDYVGVELHAAEHGKHDGNVNGVQYFQCEPDRGIFVKFAKVIMAWR